MVTGPPNANTHVIEQPAETAASAITAAPGAGNRPGSNSAASHRATVLVARRHRHSTVAVK